MAQAFATGANTFILIFARKDHFFTTLGKECHKCFNTDKRHFRYIITQYIIVNKPVAEQDYGTLQNDRLHWYKYLTNCLDIILIKLFYHQYKGFYFCTYLYR